MTTLKADSSIRRIALSGSVSVVRQLLDAGLLDELHLFVHPATAGTGMRLFDEGAPPRHLKSAVGPAVPHGRGSPRLRRGIPDPPTGSYEEAKQSLPDE